MAGAFVSDSANIARLVPSTRIESLIGEHNQQAIRISVDCLHGFTVVGTEQAILINFPTNLYDDPDEERLPPDTEKIPMDWDEQPH